jgi:DNA-binding NarL/FixJ family response regulator
VRTAGAASDAEVALLDPSYIPDVVLCDVFLPGANGDSLHTRISQRRPEVARRFVFVTGGALGKAEAAYLRVSGCPTLFKPVDLASLLELLEDSDLRDSSPPNSVRTLGPASVPSPSSPRTTMPPTTRHRR